MHYHFASVIVNLPAPVELVMQVDFHAKMRLTLQIINGFSRALQNLLKNFDGTMSATSFVLPSEELFPVFFMLDFNDSESVDLSFGSSF